jgi:hypothetical protein
MPRENEDLFKEPWGCEYIERAIHEAIGRKVIRFHNMLENYGNQIEGKVNESSHDTFVQVCA